MHENDIPLMCILTRAVRIRVQAQLVADAVRSPYIQVTLETGSSVSLASLAAKDAKARVQKTRNPIAGNLLCWTLMRALTLLPGQGG